MSRYESTIKDQVYATGWPVKHGRVFPVPCKSSLPNGRYTVHAVTLITSLFPRYHKTRPCLTGHPVVYRLIIDRIGWYSIPPGQYKHYINTSTVQLYSREHVYTSSHRKVFYSIIFFMWKVQKNVSKIALKM